MRNYDITESTFKINMKRFSWKHGFPNREKCDKYQVIQKYESVRLSFTWAVCFGSVKGSLGGNWQLGKETQRQTRPNIKIKRNKKLSLKFSSLPHFHRLILVWNQQSCRRDHKILELNESRCFLTLFLFCLKKRTSFLTDIWPGRSLWETFVSTAILVEGHALHVFTRVCMHTHGGPKDVLSHQLDMCAAPKHLSRELMVLRSLEKRPVHPTLLWW